MYSFSENKLTLKKKKKKKKKKLMKILKDQFLA